MDFMERINKNFKEKGNNQNTIYPEFLEDIDKIKTKIYSEFLADTKKMKEKFCNDYADTVLKMIMIYESTDDEERRTKVSELNSDFHNMSSKIFSLAEYATETCDSTSDGAFKI